jgi:hypothetical protein
MRLSSEFFDPPIDSAGAQCVRSWGALMCYDLCATPCDSLRLPYRNPSIAATLREEESGFGSRSQVLLWTPFDCGVVGVRLTAATRDVRLESCSA